MDPSMFATLFNSKFGAGLGQGLGGAFGDTAPFVGGSSSAMAYGIVDHSGWAVNVGSGSQDAVSTPTHTSSAPMSAGGAAELFPTGIGGGGFSQAGVGMLPGLLLAGVAVVMLIKGRK